MKARRRVVVALLGTLIAASLTGCINNKRSSDPIGDVFERGAKRTERKTKREVNRRVDNTVDDVLDGVWGR